jgi:hypothetical protein
MLPTSEPLVGVGGKRDDDNEEDAEEQADRGDACPLRPVQRARRVLLDVLRPDRVEELRPLLLHLDPS